MLAKVIARFVKPINSTREAFVALSILTFFFSAQVSLTLYIDSSYLVHTIEKSSQLSAMKLWDSPERAVGTLYTFASLITLFMLTVAPRVLRKFGNYHWTLGALIVHALFLLGLGMFESAWFIIPLFMVETALVSTLYFNFDIFLEHYSSDGNTGVIRGFFLTIGSIAWLLPPTLAGVVIERHGFPMVYLIGAAIVIPIIFLMIRYFSKFQDLQYENAPLLWPKDLSKEKPDVSRVLSVNFLLHVFYAIMIIYAPLYFHTVLGFSYNEFGLMLTIALSAFILFPAIEGWIADKWLGEKELLVAGFFLMGATSIAIPYLSAAPWAGFLVWAILLFGGRIGAATVESMAETYFFKQIDGHNSSLIGFFRRSRPLAFIVAPLVTTIILQWFALDFGTIFTVLGVVMLCAIYFPLRLVDTK